MSSSFSLSSSFSSLSSLCSSFSSLTFPSSSFSSPPPPSPYPLSLLSPPLSLPSPTVFAFLAYLYRSPAVCLWFISFLLLGPQVLSIR
eukprot:m.53873 g.53873  ORF g.53873 m.53873 type:complete len:88 (-) comp12825_c0_seq1:1504-1767(-)